MRPLTTAELFTYWEQVSAQPLLNRMIDLLSRSLDQSNHAVVANISIGERDARLLQLREWLFGDKMQHTANCPVCKEKVEWETTTGSFKLQSISTADKPIEFELTTNGYAVRYRLVTSMDILRLLQQQPDPEQAKSLLLNACLLQVTHEGKETSSNSLPLLVMDAIETAMSQNDPQADMQVALNCPACAHQWESHFDIMQFLWTEVNHWAQRLMQEIFLLARSFHWSEKDILALTPRRRQLYIQMIQG